MQHHAFHENLTRILDASRKTNTHGALIIIAIDHTQEMNNSFGAGTSNHLLHHVEDILRQNIPGHAVIQRLGDDRVAIAMAHVKQTSDAEALSKHLLGIMQHPIRIDQHDVYISASAGLAFFPEDADTSNSLLTAAETALRWAQEDNEHAIVHRYSHATQIEATQRYQLINELFNAIEHEEYVNFYQPKINLQSGKVVGCEALTRWKHPTHGMLQPDTFIPILEEKGLIIPLGEWTLHDACKQLQQWHQAGIMLEHVAVNISAQQFCAPDFVRMVDSSISTYGLKPSELELELTESCLLENVDHALRVFNELKEVGVHLSIDDFGVGYSSLRYLKDIPLDALKIDRSFVAEIVSNHQVSAICQSMVELGHHLDLDVIAEGVETPAQLEKIREYQCDFFQGFLCSKALPENEFRTWLPKNLVWITT